MSGLWGYQTALDLFLKENGITTLFFSGVNADQVSEGLYFPQPVWITTLKYNRSVFSAPWQTPISVDMIVFWLRMEQPPLLPRVGWRMFFTMQEM